MKRVLIVDDGAFMRIMIKNILSKHGYEVVGEAADGVQALERYKELCPDLVTMDITMPNMNGIEALKKIMELDPKATVIMVSAMGQEAYVREAIRCGARSFVVKPFNEDSLMAVLQSY